MDSSSTCQNTPTRKCSRCRQAFEPEPKPGGGLYKTCPACRAWNKANWRRWSPNQRELREWYKARGICPHCGRAFVEPGHTYCKACFAQSREYKAAHRPDPAIKRAFRQARIEAGLCIDCGRPSEGKSRCPRCLKMAGDSRRKYRINQRIEREAEEARKRGKVCQP